MPWCYETDESRAEDPALLTHARIEAQRWSNETYGEDCYVCAEFLPAWAGEGQVFLHITSPVPEALINTSAGVALRRADGKVVDRMKWHSCHARVIKRTESKDSAP